MELRDFPGCCGAGVLLNLDNEYALQRLSPGAAPLPPNDFNVILANIKAFIKNSEMRSWGLLTATTNPQQTEVEALLVKCGFKLCDQFLAPKHGYDLKLWGLHLANLDLTYLDAITL